MSDQQAESPGPRRSQRDKKTVKPFVSGPSSSFTRKRKRADAAAAETDTENDAPDPSEADEADQRESEEEDEEPDEHKTPRARKPKAKSSPKAKSTPVAKKPRGVKNLVPKLPKPTARRGRPPKEGDPVYDAEQVAKETKISADNPLFNAIMNPASALQSSAEDFLESLQQTPGAALAELINLVLRACGCNDSVDSDKAVDFDGIVSALDDFTEVLKQENSPVYPLTSKLPVFKRFRKSLSEWIERLVISASALGSLYSSQMMDTLQQWVVSMSSSQIRSFRHTATVIALEAETALCEVAAAVDKESHVISRQREGEKKRKGKGGNPQLDAKAKEVRQRQSKLKAFIKEFVDGVFVHRFRDLDPNIRAECVRALGQWLGKYPEHFLDANYLRYIGWVLSDADNHVRLEAVKALSGVYDQTDYLHSVTNFTERFKPRLLEMATSDVDLSIRVAVVRVLGDIESHFPLEEDEKEKLCLLLFDEEPRVRRAVSAFVRSVWEEEVEEKLSAERKLSDKDKERIGVKALAQLLVKWGKALDNISGDAADSDNGDEDAEEGGDEVNGRRQSKRRKELITLVAPEDRGRIAMAVEALWSEVEPVSNWEDLLELLLLDHSTPEEPQAGSAPRGAPRVNGKKHKDDFHVEGSWRLEEAEEGALLEVLVAAVRLAKEGSVGGKKGEEENVSNDITRALIKGIPRLFIKHQSDQNRIAEVLVLPSLMNLDLYLEMRMISGYSSLWDDVIKQFTSHTSGKVLAHAMAAIRHFMVATSLSNSNSTKILELEDELSTQLRDIIAGRDEIETATFSEDEVLTLGAWCMRLSVLVGARNMTTWIEEDEGGKQSSAWDIISALVERGRLGYKEEETLVERALQVLMLHVLWKTKGLPAEDEPTAEEIRYVEVMKEQRGSLIEKLVEYAIGTQSNTVAGVKQAAFRHLLDLHVLFSPSDVYAPDGTALPIASYSLTLDDETQYRCAGFIQAEIERYAELIDDGEEVAAVSHHSDGSNEDDEAPRRRPQRKQSRDQSATPNARDLLTREYLFIEIVSTFLRAIRAGVVRIQHGAVVLAHYGRLGLAFDVCSKVVVDVLRQESVMKESPDIVVSVVTQALEEAYALVLDGIVSNRDNAVQLAKLLSTCFIVRGNQLAILRRLPNQDVVQIHTNLISWISKRMSGYQKNDNKNGLKLAAAFFRVLIPLSNPLTSADALKIKAHMDQILELTKVEIQPNAKLWEAQKAYEKKLTSIMAKENPTKTRKSKKKAVNEDETDGERTNDEDQEAAAAAAVAPAPPTRKSSRVTRSNPAGGEQDQDVSTGDEEAPVTPKKRKPPRPRPKTKQKTPERIGESLRVSPMATDGAPPENAEVPLTVEETPTITTTTLKRPRSPDERSDEIINGVDGAAEEPEEPDIQVRRKRIRH